MTENSIILDSLNNKQLIKTVFDKNDQMILEEGTLLASADLVLLKSRNVSLENIEYTEPLKFSDRNILFNQLEGELLLDFDYPAPMTIPGQPGQVITSDLLKKLCKLNICPSYYLKRTFRGISFDIVAPLQDNEGYEVILPKGSHFTLGILKSLVRSGFHLFDFIPRIKSKTAIKSLDNNTQFVPKGVKYNKRHITKLMFSAIGGVEPAKPTHRTCKKVIMSADNTLFALKGGKVTHSLISKIKEHSHTTSSPDIFTLLEGRPCPVNIVKIASKREELKSVNLLKLFQIKNFDISLLYRNFGYEELAHWFDPFLDIIFRHFGGGMVIQKCGSAFDPIDPLREYSGMMKVQLIENIHKDTEKKNISRSSQIRKMTNPGVHPISRNAKQKIKQAGGRFLALMCMIESKRRVPTVFYDTTLQQDIMIVKNILSDISKRMDIETGLRIQEGKLL